MDSGTKRKPDVEADETPEKRGRKAPDRKGSILAGNATSRDSKDATTGSKPSSASKPKRKYIKKADRAASSSKSQGQQQNHTLYDVNSDYFTNMTDEATKTALNKGVSYIDMVEDLEQTAVAGMCSRI